MNMKKEIIIWCLIICGMGATLNAATYYVSTTGSDSNSGLDGHPRLTVKKGVELLTAPGDTLLIREGLYRESLPIVPPAPGTEEQPITIKAYPGEKVVISGMIDASGTWTLVPNRTNVYSYAAVPANVLNVSQNGKPLKLAISYANYAGSPDDVQAAGDWSRKIYIDPLTQTITASTIWVYINGDPGSSGLEYSTQYQVFWIPNYISHITVEDLTIEGGYYPIYVDGDYCIFKNCVFRNCFGDAFKSGDSCNLNGETWNSTNGQIINCDMYYFGESGIDLTGGDYWTITNCTIHDGIQNRSSSEGKTKLNGIMMKNKAVGDIVEGCRIYNIDGPFGAITIGGDTYYNAHPATALKIRNNIIHNITAPYVISFMGAENCVFANNLIYGCHVKTPEVQDDSEALIEFKSGPDDHTTPYTYFNNSGNTVQNNIFYDNDATYNYKEDIQHGDNDYLLKLDYNIVESRNSYFDGTSMDHAAMNTKGYDGNSPTGTPTFVDYSYGLVRLAASSVGIADGMYLDDITDVTNDYNGIERSLGSAFDIGPFEIRDDSSIYSDGTSITGWTIPAGVTLSPTHDPTLNRDVLLCSGSSGPCELFKDAVQSPWNNTTQFVISWKAAFDPQYRHAFTVRLKIKGDENWKYIKFYSWYTTTNFSNLSFLRFPLGAGQATYEDGNWHTYVFDLQAALKQALPDNNIDFIDHFYAENADAAGMSLTDVELNNGFSKSYSDGTSTAGWTLASGVTVNSLNDPTLGLGRKALKFNNCIGICELGYSQPWDNKSQFVVTWKAKFSGNHAFAVRLTTKSNVSKVIKFYSWYTVPNLNDPNYLRFPLGAGQEACGDGNWHTYVFDLQAALKQGCPEDSIDFIEYFCAENAAAAEMSLTDIELHNNCIGEWNFNESCGSKVEDTSGGGRHGKLISMPVTEPLSSAWTIGRMTKALQFGGNNSNSYVTIPNLSAVSFSEGLTFSAWVKYDNLNDTYKAIASGLTGYVGYPRMYQNYGGIKFQVRMDGGNLVEVSSDTNKITAGVWTHVAAVVDMNAKIIKLYINGNEEGSSDPLIYSSIDCGTYPLYLGSDYFESFFRGCIDEVKLYNCPLSAAEIAILKAE